MTASYAVQPRELRRETSSLPHKKKKSESILAGNCRMQSKIEFSSARRAKILSSLILDISPENVKKQSIIPLRTLCSKTVKFPVFHQIYIWLQPLQRNKRLPPSPSKQRDLPLEGANRAPIGSKSRLRILIKIKLS